MSVECPIMPAHFLEWVTGCIIGFGIFCFFCRINNLAGRTLNVSARVCVNLMDRSHLVGHDAVVHGGRVKAHALRNARWTWRGSKHDCDSGLCADTTRYSWSPPKSATRCDLSLRALSTIPFPIRPVNLISRLRERAPWAPAVVIKCFFTQEMTGWNPLALYSGWGAHVDLSRPLGFFPFFFCLEERRNQEKQADRCELVAAAGL